MELTIIILYLLAIFGVGIYCNKFNKGLDDYLVAGRRLGVGLATGTLVATYFGGGYVIVTLMKKKFVDSLHWIDESHCRRSGHSGRLPDSQENGRHEALHRDGNRRASLQ